MDFWNYGTGTWLTAFNVAMAVVGVVMAIWQPTSTRSKIAYCAFFIVAGASTVLMTRAQERRTQQAEAESAKGAEDNRSFQRQLRQGQDTADKNTEYLKGQLTMLTGILAQSPLMSPQKGSAQAARPQPPAVDPSKAQGAAIRAQLAEFMAEGASLTQQCLTQTKTAPPVAAANTWATKVHLYLKEHLDPSFDIGFPNPPAPLPITHSGVPEEHDNLWRGINVRVDVLRSLIAELRD